MYITVRYFKENLLNNKMLTLISRFTSVRKKKFYYYCSMSAWIVLYVFKFFAMVSMTTINKNVDYSDVIFNMISTETKVI